MISLHHLRDNKINVERDNRIMANEDIQIALKKRAAERALDFVFNDQIVGLGTGSTISFALMELGKRVSEGLTIKGVPTSKATERIARELGIPIIPFNEVQNIDVVIDGADEIDSTFNMIKGGGGALTREKLIALAAHKRVIVVDCSKIVRRLGEKFSLPVEVLPFAWRSCSKKLEGLDCQPYLRQTDQSVFETDNGNYILDCKFDGINNAVELECEIKKIPGIVESGLFVGITDVLVVGFTNKIEIRFKSDSHSRWNQISNI